jgi:Sulfotransferase domain
MAKLVNNDKKTGRAMIKKCGIGILIYLAVVGNMWAHKQWAGPDFLIIGTQKGGTTSLYKYLIKHPHIKWAKRKEIHFFDRHYTKGVDWYQEQFPKKDKQSDFLTGEATPAYMFHPLAAERIGAAFPNVKLIVVLRNPVERAYSQYKMYARKGLEKRLFEQAIKQERAMVAKESEKIIESGDEGYWSKDYNNFSYVSRGMYLDQLKRCMRYFNKEQLLVISSEDLMNKTEETVNVVLRFLGLEEQRLPNYGYYHVGHNNELVIDPATRASLATLFKPMNDALQRYLRDELGQRVKLNWN